MRKFLLSFGLLLWLTGCSGPPEDPRLVEVAAEGTAVVPSATPVPPTATSPPPTPTNLSPTNTPETSAAIEPAAPEPTPTQQPVMRLFEFDSLESTGAWFIVNDSVMGGISQSGAEIIEDGVLLFTGEVSLDNNGGFASLRSDNQPFGMNAESHIVLRVRGDGQLYRLQLRNNARADNVAYTAFFEAPNDEWQEITIPFSDFQPLFRSQVVPDYPALDPSQISSVGFMIQDNQVGAFRLEVDWIGAE